MKKKLNYFLTGLSKTRKDTQMNGLTIILQFFYSILCCKKFVKKSKKNQEGHTNFKFYEYFC
ncbi:MAG: hypothetical protein RL757_2577 [Bacteroidota bacterium]|jgi:hypothetical protein